MKRKLLDIVSEACGYTKGVDKDKNADVDVAVYRKSYFGFENTVRMREIGRNTVRQKKMLRD